MQAFWGPSCRLRQRYPLDSPDDRRSLPANVEGGRATINRDRRPETTWFADTTVFRYNGRMKRVALYARVSTGVQTVENQLRELRAVAERIGWTVVDEFVDQGVWGAKGRDKRPALDSMLKAVIRGEVDVVAACRSIGWAAACKTW